MLVRAAALIAVVLLPATAGATTVVAKDLGQLCAEADVIFVGTVTDVHSQWVDPDRRAIETVVTFADLVTVVGSPGDPLRLRFSGGVVDDIREEVAGVPRFTVGERVLLFARLERSLSPIVGLNQGLFLVADSPRGPVLLDANGRPVVGVRNGVVEVGPAGAETESAVPLPTFLESVRREIAARPRE